MADRAGDWPAEAFAKDLVVHLRSRTMPGLPHVGVIGPRPDDVETEDAPVDVDDTDVQPMGGFGTDDEDELDWNFVPYKMKYHLTIKPTPENRNETKVDFYIRIKEGCDGDVGKDLIKMGRPEKYVLTEEELQKAFRHYKVYIDTPSDPAKTVVSLLVDGQKQSLQANDLNIRGNITEIILRDKSEPFLNYERGSPMLVQQEYNVRIKKEVEDKGDGSRIIALQVVNESPRTKRSTLPTLKENESEEDCRNRTKVGGKKKKVDLGLDPLWPYWKPRLYKITGGSKNPEGNRYGYLMEFHVSELISSYTPPIGPRDMARITNAVFEYPTHFPDAKNVYSGEIVFRDHTTFREDVPKMTPGSPPIDVLANLGMNPELGRTLQDDLRYKQLNKFQEDSIEKIQGSLKDERIDTILISARTAGGKTEAFLIPILDLCLNTASPGVKAIIFYPTKALANDQASRFIKILYHLNKRFKNRKITVGILHGDIAKDDEKVTEEEAFGLPFECPRCDIGLLRPVSPEHVVCDNSECGITLDFVWAHTRTQIYSNPPDILITNPDTLIWDLMLRPEHHSIFGRSVFACQDCGRTYAPKGSKSSCNGFGGCNGRNLKAIDPVAPSFLVFDEVHLFKGSFGINCSYVLSRIEYAIKKYAKEYHSIDPHKIVRIGSTATISNEEEFVRKFFNVKEGQYSLVPQNRQKREEYYIYGESDKSFKRYHVFVMPYAYSSDSTVGLAIQYLEARAKNGKPPTRFEPTKDALDKYLQILTFVNAIKTSNALISQTRRTVAGDLPDLQIDGHTTDFDRSQRSVVERKFNTRDLHVVFATSTLEVGVDFRQIHCVIINGFPYSFNDYLQRIGRGGRRNDSLVITVCQNWKPVDHFYYAHGKISLQNQHENIEPVPITRENSEAVKKHLQGALLDHIVRNKDVEAYELDDIRTFASINDNRPTINPEVLSACGIPKSLEVDAITQLDEFVSFLTQQAKTAGTSGQPRSLYSRFLKEINPRYNLTSLRSTDPEVTVEVFWNK